MRRLQHKIATKKMQRLATQVWGNSANFSFVFPQVHFERSFYAQLFRNFIRP
jgi:hypothetical protein